MGKSFTILGISSDAAPKWFHLCIQAVDNPRDLRYLHIEPKGDSGIVGDGVEMSSDWKTTYGGPGYILKEVSSKPINQWAVGDTVSEQCYPEEFDGRK